MTQVLLVVWALVLIGCAMGSWLRGQDLNSVRAARAMPPDPEPEPFGTPGTFCLVQPDRSTTVSHVL